MAPLCVKLLTKRLWSDVRQCLIYDTPEPNARLIGVEYMISGTLYKTLDSEERKLWHSHVYEVKSGMLILPGPKYLPQSVWEAAETKEMEQVVGLYGKTYHFWQVDRGDKLPLGQPQLMISFTEDAQLSESKSKLIDRNERFSVDCEANKAKRSYIAEPDIHGGEYNMLIKVIRVDGILIYRAQTQTMRGKSLMPRKNRTNPSLKDMFSREEEYFLITCMKPWFSHSFPGSPPFEDYDCALRHSSIQS